MATTWDEYVKGKGGMAAPDQHPAPRMTWPEYLANKAKAEPVADATEPDEEAKAEPKPKRGKRS